MNEGEMNTKPAKDTFLRRAAGAIIVIVFLVTGSVMLPGGCSDDGPGGCRRQEIRLACPALSYAGESCIGYRFDVIDDFVEPPVALDSFLIYFKRHCNYIDCFTLTCLDITTDSGTLLPVADIIIETVGGQPVGGDEIVDRGSPGGRIIIDGEDFLLESAGMVVP